MFLQSKFLFVFLLLVQHSAFGWQQQSDGYCVVVHTVCRHGFVHIQYVACVHVTSILHDICATACHARLVELSLPPWALKHNTDCQQHALQS